MMDIPTDTTEYRRALQKASTPDQSEFLLTAGVATGGIGLIGFVGLVIFVIMSLIPM